MATRLDMALVERGVVASRSRARDLIRRGFVEVDGAVVQKPAAMVAGRAAIRLRSDAPRFVSRGGEKLSAILDHCGLVESGFGPSGRRALDIGASTGGFTDVLLRRGAVEVVAVDVGHDQLSGRLRDRPDVRNLEGTDARQLTLELIGGPVDVIVADVSFISLLKVLPHAFGLAAAHCVFAGLIKPQFEVGPAEIGKGGIVTNTEARELAVARVVAWISDQPGWRVVDVIQSPIAGGSGNVEYLIGAVRDE